MNVLVTGHKGFVGRHMTDFLVSYGHTVFGCDMENPGGLVPFLHQRQNSFDLVVHCAYNVGGRQGIDYDMRALGRNLILDAELFDWCDPDRVGHVIYFSSSAMYPTHLQRRSMAEMLEATMNIEAGTKPWEPLRLEESMANTDSLGIMGEPDSRYGWAKLTGERLAGEYRRRGGSVSVVRPFSGYGADQGLEYPFPAFINRALEVVKTNNDVFDVWGSAKSTRDWIHIEDVVAGAIAVADCQRGSCDMADCRVPFERRTEPVNLCTGRAIRFGDLASMVLHEAGAPEGIMLNQLGEMPTGVFHRVGDPTRMFDYYEPIISLEEGIEEAVSHVRG